MELNEVQKRRLEIERQYWEFAKQMSSSKNGCQHTICESHARAEEPTVEMKREYLIKRLKNYTWKKPEELAKDREEILALTEDRVDERYRDYSYEGGHQCRCPICNFEKLDVSEGLRFLLKKSGMTPEQLAQQMGQEFKTYDVFLDYITPPKQ